MMAENTADDGHEREQSDALANTYHDHPTEPYVMPDISHDAKFNFLSCSGAIESVLEEEDVKAGASLRTSTEKTFQPDMKSSISIINFMSSADGADEESPITDAGLSEPKTGTTITSYRTNASSPTSPMQMEAAFRLEPSISRDNGGARSEMTDPMVVPDYSLLNVALLSEGIEKKPNCALIDAWYPCEDYVKMEIEKENPSVWQNRGASLHLMASAPEFRPFSMETAESEQVCHDTPSREPLMKAGTASVYNPLAVEWCPSTERNSIGLEREMQIQTGWPQSALTVRPPLSIETLERTKCSQMMKAAKEGYHLDVSDGNFDVMKAARFETPASVATTSIVASEPRDRTVEEPRRGRAYATQPKIATLNQIRHFDRTTLAQRRAERQFTNEHIRSSQVPPTTAEIPAAPLLMMQETAESNRVASAQSPSTPASQQGQPYSGPHKHIVTWKGVPRPDPDHVPVNLEFEEWLKIEQDLLRMGLIKRWPGKPDGGSFVVPKHFEQWLEFRTGRTEDLLLQKVARINRKRAEVEAATRVRQVFSIDDAQGRTFDSRQDARDVKISSAMHGKEYRDGRCTVLAQPSTWSPWFEPTEERPEALWPCTEEMKEEGDERHTSAFGRFLALPRVPGNPTVVWKVKPVIPPLPFDEIWKVPNKDTWADLHIRMTEDFEEEYMKALVGQSLLDAIEC